MNSANVWTVKSRSVDTVTYISLLKKKSKIYDLMQGLSEQESLRKMSKLERQLRVMEFMENSRRKNPFRTLALKKLFETQGDTFSKQKLREKLLKEQNTNSSPVARSEGQSQESRKRKRRTHGYYPPKQY